MGEMCDFFCKKRERKCIRVSLFENLYTATQQCHII
jgi:hypothetical protein